VYFAALLARTEDGWEASDTELDEVESLTDLADLARQASSDDDTVLLCIEQENAWFGIVRVDGEEEDPRVYVSDAAAALRSSYGEILLTDELLGREPEDPAALDQLVDLDGTEDGEPEEDEDTDEPGAAMVVRPGPLGDPGLLADFGMEESAVLTLTAQDALNAVAEMLGCTDVLEAVR
jgi:putative tRNA adenosine deaminase-associated protein